MLHFEKLSRIVSLIFISVSVLAASPSVDAATRAILIPGRTALILMEGVTAAGVDPDPRRLYDSIVQTPVGQQGGEAKIVKSVSKDFSITCGTKNTSYESVICNIAVKRSDRSQLDAASATYLVEGGESLALYELVAGAGATVPFLFETSDKKIRIEATPAVFKFSFRQ